MTSLIECDCGPNDECPQGKTGAGRRCQINRASHAEIVGLRLVFDDTISKDRAELRINGEVRGTFDLEPARQPDQAAAPAMAKVG